MISKEKINEVLSRATYWNEVVKREDSSVSGILWDELKEVVKSLGIEILWILEKHAKENKMNS